MTPFSHETVRSNGARYCPYCGSIELVHQDEAGTYHCHSCDAEFGLRRNIPLLRSGALVIDCEAKRVQVAGKEVDLTATEFRLLEFFVRHPGVVYTRVQLLNAIWGLDRVVTDTTVDVYIRRLRKKLDPPCVIPGDCPRRHVLGTLIVTHRGFGYSFNDVVIDVPHEESISPQLQVIAATNLVRSPVRRSCRSEAPAVAHGSNHLAPVAKMLVIGARSIFASSPINAIFHTWPPEAHDLPEGFHSARSLVNPCAKFAPAGTILHSVKIFLSADSGRRFGD